MARLKFLTSIFLVLIVIQVDCIRLIDKTNTTSIEYKYKPVVFWHGMGDTAFGSINSLIKLIKQELNKSIYITSIEIGDNIQKDFLNSYFGSVKRQVQEACKKIQRDDNLQDGFTLIGFSQGGQFARALVQKCFLKKPVINLITLGAQHQGIYGIPKCINEKANICHLINKLFNRGVYTPTVQKRLVQAQYWHDAVDYDNYVNNSLFLAELNNEVVINKLYIKRMTELKNFVMVKFDKDTIVDPTESEHFGFFEKSSNFKIEKLEDSKLYKEDRLGLRTLDESNRLIKLNLPGDHLRIPLEWFKSIIINQYIKTEININ